MPAPVQSTRNYRFGVFEANLARGELLRQGKPVRLQDQPLRVLTILLERAGEVVPREELRQRLWPADTYVEFDGSLNAALKRLRFALGDSADNPIFIETVPKRGYRFIAPVTCDPPAVPPALAAPSAEPDARSLNPLWWGVIPLLAVLSFVAWRSLGRSHPPAPPAPKIVAVLPFSNQGAGPDFDYLRYAIANQLVTDLTHAHSLSVRPFASTSRFDAATSDPATIGKDLRVTHVLTGSFILNQQNLQVNLELVEVASNQAIWRDEINTPRENLVGLSRQLAARSAQGVLPALNVSRDSMSRIATPNDERALRLYLHSIGVSHDPVPNKVAIQNLEESVALDADYWPAWEELAWRYYIDYTYGNGGDDERAKGIEIYNRLLKADPGGTANTVTLRTERGDLNGAYDEAADLLRRRPDSSSSHYEMSYLLRYAGLLDEAGKQCHAALAIDPGFSAFRSCAVPFILSNDYDSARIYIRLDENTSLAATYRMEIALRTGDQSSALHESELAAQSDVAAATLVHRFLTHASSAELQQATAEVEKDPKAERDPEIRYRNAAALSYIGQSEAALRQLRKAIENNYCSYPAIDLDPRFNPLHDSPAFQSIRQKAIACRQAFETHRQQVDAR